MKIFIYILGTITLMVYYLSLFITFVLLSPFKLYCKITGNYKLFFHKYMAKIKAKDLFKDTGKIHYVIELDRFYNIVGDKFLENNPGNKKKIIFTTDGS